MKIDAKKDNNSLIITLEGRLDTNTYSELEKSLGDLTEIKTIIFDFEKLDYISSAGLRVLLSCRKEMDKKSGNVIVKNVKDQINDVFEVTGFSDVLTIEK